MRARTLAAVLALLPNAASAYGQGGSMPGPTLHALGFGDVLYEATERDVAAGFRLGQVVGHLSAGLTDRLSAFGEFTATAHAADFGLGVERLIVRYDFSDRFKLSLGRYHTPISYWNTAFHHGLWLQTTVARPEMIRFGSPFLPVHFLGLLAEGSLLPGGLGLKYAAGVGNGRAADIRQPGDAGDVNDRRAWLGSLSAEPAVLGHLRLGGAVLLDRASPEPDRQADQRILSAHVVWTQESPEVIAEYARLIDEPVGADPAPSATPTTSSSPTGSRGPRAPSSRTSVASASARRATTRSCRR